jgi:hypothetical protein
MSECDKEPCKSLIDAYWAKAIDAHDAAFACRVHCDLWKAALRGFWMLFAIWFAVFAYAVACTALHLPPWACAGLTWASLALLAALIVLGIRTLQLRALAAEAEKACRRRYSEMLSAHRAISVQCPRECRPEIVRIECGC